MRLLSAMAVVACCSHAAVFSIPIHAQVNTPPQAEDDVYDTEVDDPLSVEAPGVLENDTDEDNDPLEAELVDDPSEGGTVDLRPDGSFDYTPPPGFEGDDVFTYRAFDGTDYGNTAEVTIRVGAPAEPFTIYTDEAAYLSGLAALGHLTLAEGFEDDAAWGSARTPNTLPSVTSQGVNWTSNNETSEVTTGSGPVRTGAYGFFCLPHGNYATGTDCNIPGNCTDGWIGTGDGTLYGVGGWIEGTFGGAVEFFLDGVVVDFGDGAGITSAHKFFGVIHPDGFRTFEVHEMEGKAEDQKLIFSDDFTFGIPAAISLSISRGFGPGEVTLEWWGGQPMFTVFRSDDPATVTEPGNEIGTTSEREWSDTPPGGHLFFYRIAGP